MGFLGVTRIGNTEFRWGERTYVMGIINLSPDSFSGDGLSGIDEAVKQARRFVGQGADILDVGGESTRPGAQAIEIEEEIKRVVPVIARLVREVSVPVSVDTCKFEVAGAAVEAGAALINDQWGLRYDGATKILKGRLAALAAAKNIPVILMSNQRRGNTVYDVRARADLAAGSNVMAQVNSFLKESLEIARQSGIPPENTIIDPGIGFGKDWKQNLEVIRRLAELKKLGRPVLIGTSRKSFIGRILGDPPESRMLGTAATVALSIANGADIVRVHDVLPMVKVCRMCDAIVRDYHPGAE
jgi:dihydropteroate synthase